MPRAGLNRDKVLEAAVALLDRDGLEALSMRRLGESLGVEAMSLYRHVANKTDLLDGVYDALLAELDPLPVRRGPWAEDLAQHARAFRAMLARHPHAAVLFASRPAVTTTSLAHLDASLTILRDAGFAPGPALAAFQTLLAFVVGQALVEHSVDAPGDAPTVDYAALPVARFPQLAAMRRTLAAYAPADDFEFGLGTMLRGLAVRLDERKPRARR